jgi:hypothetical protein
MPKWAGALGAADVIVLSGCLDRGGRSAASGDKRLPTDREVAAGPRRISPTEVIPHPISLILALYRVSPIILNPHNHLQIGRSSSRNVRAKFSSVP